MALTDVYKLVGDMTFATNRYQFTLALGSRLPGVPLQSDFQALADAFKEVCRPSQHNLLAYTTWEATQLWGPTMSINTPLCTRSGGLSFSGNFTAPLTGAATGTEPAAPQLACVTTLMTGQTGRRKRGRNYMCGLTEAGQAGGLFDNAFLSPLQTAWTSFYSAYGALAVTGSFFLGVWSERTATGCVPKVPGPGHVVIDTPHPESAFTASNGFRIRPVVYTQRRRTLGVGR